MRKKWLKIISILIIIILILLLTAGLLKHHQNNRKENITTILKSDEDFLNWFKDFDKLYKNKIKRPKYSLNEKIFEEINKLLNNEEVKNITYENDKYIINNNTYLELDVNTRSLKYTKYKDKKIIEILEVRLKDGKYYVQLAKDKHLYKILFNNKDSKIDKKEIKKIEIKKSIYATEKLKW